MGKIAKWLTHRYLPLILSCLAMALALPCLWTGLWRDGYWIYASILRPPALEGLFGPTFSSMFAVNRMGLSKSLRRCLTTTNLIESPNAGVRARAGRVARWQNGAMVLRWAATASLDADKSFRRIMGYRDLWQLKAYLDENERDERMESENQAA